MPIISKADTHIHTSYSYGSMKPCDLVDFVYHRTSLRLIAITDHDTILGALDAQAYLEQNNSYKSRLNVIIGSEIKSAEGHIIGLFLNKDVRPFQSAESTIQEIHNQGGIAVAPHPFSHWLAWLGMKGVGTLIRDLPFDAIETRSSSFSEIYANYLVQFCNNRWQHLPAIGGSDGYTKAMIGKTHTLFHGHTPKDFFESVANRKVHAEGSVCSPLIMYNLFRNRSLSFRNKTTGWE